MLDKAFTSLGFVSIALMALALVFILAPMIWRGAGAFIFRGTVEHRKLTLEEFDRGDKQELDREVEEVRQARQPVYRALHEYEASFSEGVSRLVEKAEGLESRMKGEAQGAIKDGLARIREREEWQDKFSVLSELAEEVAEIELETEPEISPGAADLRNSVRGITSELEALEEIKEGLRKLMGPLPGEKTPLMLHEKYGRTRWDAAEKAAHNVLYKQEWDYSDPTRLGIMREIPRVEIYAGTALEPLFVYIADNLEEIMRPEMVFYWRFLTDPAKNSHFFGGVWSELIGTFYLTLGAIVFAVPIGVIAAIYLCEYAREGPVISIIRTCVSTLAGVPSIVFGLFGLAFFLNTIHVTGGTSHKSVLAGSLTLALLILPTVIRASEEAILSVPMSYKEAALALGAGKWRTVLTIILPAALPGILTGIVISMGRAAGETAPIIFTAAVSVGEQLSFSDIFSQPTTALPWSIYMMCSEHPHADQIRHMQFGMVFVLVGLVLALNMAAIIMRARISKKLRG